LESHVNLKSVRTLN